MVSYIINDAKRQQISITVKEIVNGAAVNGLLQY